MSFNIEVEGGKSVRLPTAGKYCDRDIVVTATGGGNDGYDEFWDLYQNNGKRTDYQNAFYNWPKDCFSPKYSILGTISGCFRGSSVTDIKTEIVAKNSSANAFYNCTSLESIWSLDLTNSSNLSYVFQNCSSLREIRIVGTINLDVSFSHSKLLSAESIQSIIDALGDRTGAEARTLTLHGDVGGNLTDEQKAAITAKNWALVY